MSMNFHCFVDVEAGWSASWCNNGEFCYHTNQKSIPDPYLPAEQQAKEPELTEQRFLPYFYTSFTPNYIKQIMDWIDSGEKELVLKNVKHPSMFGTRVYEEEWFFRDEEKIYLPHWGEKNTTIPIPISTFKAATDAITEKAAGFGPSPIRPAGGFFGTWYDEQEEKIVDRNTTKDQRLKDTIERIVDILEEVKPS